MEKLGRKIKKLRELRNYSQDYMASQLGLSQPAYSNLETNDAGLNTDRLEKIANLLEITVSDIENFDDRMIFNVTNHDQAYGGNNYTLNYSPSEKVYKLQEDKIKLLEEKNALLIEQVEMLREKVRGLEGR